MELQVYLEPLAVLGTPILIEGWVCGNLRQPEKNWPLVTYAHDKWGLDKSIQRNVVDRTEDFLLDYINLRTASERGSKLERQLCSVVAKHGVFGNGWMKPPGLPKKCADFWQRSEKYGQIPFALPSHELIEAAKSPAAELELAHALREGDAHKIAVAQAKLDRTDSEMAAIEQVAPDFGLSFLAQRLTSFLTKAQSPEGATVTLNDREDGTFVMRISTTALRTALLLALCDQLASPYRRCKTCDKWFRPRGDQVHCDQRCRTRSSVYRLRAVNAVQHGMPIEEAAKRYGVPISELGERRSQPHRKSRRKVRNRSGE